jgi:hypothetical protein
MGRDALYCQEHLEAERREQHTQLTVPTLENQHNVRLHWWRSMEHSVSQTSIDNDEEETAELVMVDFDFVLLNLVEVAKMAADRHDRGCGLGSPNHGH